MNYREKKNPKGSPQYINKLNKIRIINVIREHNQLSRAKIAKISGISAPTVTRIVDSLIKDTKLVHEVGIGESSGGRRPTLVELSSNDNYVIGIDLGTTHIDGVLANLSGETIVDIRTKTKIEQGPEHIFERVSNLICDLQNHPQASGKRILGVGLAVPGLINRQKNIIEVSPDLNWESVDLQTILNKKCQHPLKFDNVTRVMALGELWYDIGDLAKHFVVINIGYGIGAGIIIDGKPLYGPFGMAGEFGHMTVDKDSNIRCECGNYGCLEALASGRAIAERARNAIRSGETSMLEAMVQGDIDKIETKLVAQAAREGDALAQRIFEDAVAYLGAAISSLINLISPEVVLIGGGVSLADDLLFLQIREIVKNRTIQTRTRNITIKPVTFGVQAATKGAVALILDEVLSLNHLN